MTNREVAARMQAMRLASTLFFALAISFLGCNREPLIERAAAAAPQLAKRPESPQPQPLGAKKYFGPIATITALWPVKTFSKKYWTNGYFRAEGTWVTVSPKRAVDVNTAIVQCSKDEGQCIEGTAFVFNGMLGADLNVLQIERWDEHEIVTKPDDAACARNVLRISREQNRVIEVQSVFKTDGPCSMLSLGDSTRELQAGQDVAIELRSHP